MISSSSIIDIARGVDDFTGARPVSSPPESHARTGSMKSTTLGSILSVLMCLPISPSKPMKNAALAKSQSYEYESDANDSTNHRDPSRPTTLHEVTTNEDERDNDLSRSNIRDGAGVAVPARDAAASYEDIVVRHREVRTCPSLKHPPRP